MTGSSGSEDLDLSFNICKHTGRINNVTIYMATFMFGKSRLGSVAAKKFNQFCLSFVSARSHWICAHHIDSHKKLQTNILGICVYIGLIYKCMVCIKGLYI